MGKLMPGCKLDLFMLVLVSLIGVRLLFSEYLFIGLFCIWYSVVEAKTLFYKY
jgi:hypothetical protein